MLAVSACFTPDDWSGGYTDSRSVQADMLSVAFHVELLEVCGQAVKVACVGEDRDCLMAQKASVPKPCECQEDRQVCFVWRRSEMLVNLVHAREKVAERPGADREHQRKADRAVN